MMFKTKNSTLLAQLGSVSLAAGVVACGMPAADEPEVVPVPEITTNRDFGFSLNPQNETREFYGSLLVWRDGTTGEDVRAVLEASRKNTEAFVRRLDSVATLFANDLDALDAQIGAVQADRDAALAESGLRDRATRLAFADTWFEGEVEGLKATFGDAFGEAEEVRVRQVFARYCDAKLWQQAVSEELADGAFEVRPVATPVCESHYAASAAFAAPECTAQAGEKKNYFACVWKALKSTAYVQEGPLNEALHGPVLDAIAVSEQMRTFMATEPRGEKICGERITSFKRKLVDLNVGAADCLVPGSSVALNLKVVTNKAELALVAPDDMATAVDRLEDFKDRSNLYTTIPYALHFAEPLGPRADRELSALERASDELARKMRTVGYASGKCGGGKISLADKEFNLPFAELTEVSFELDKCESFPSTDDFPEMFVKDPLADELTARLDQLQIDRKSAIGKYCDRAKCEAAESQSLCAAQVAKKGLIEAVQSRAYLATTFNLKLIPHQEEDGQNWVEGRLIVSGSGRALAYGCMSGFAEGRNLEACPGEGAQAGALTKMSMSFDPASEELALAFDFNTETRRAADLDDELKLAIADTQIKMSLYPGAFEDRVPFLSGAVTFERDGEVLRRGVASYMVEQAFEAQREAKICQE